MARNNEQSSEQASAGKGPDYNVFHVREGDRGKKYWVRLGAAFRHEDGEGLNVQLDSLPVGGFDGRLVLRIPREASQKDGE